MYSLGKRNQRGGTTQNTCLTPLFAMHATPILNRKAVRKFRNVQNLRENHYENKIVGITLAFWNIDKPWPWGSLFKNGTPVPGNRRREMVRRAEDLPGIAIWAFPWNRLTSFAARLAAPFASCSPPGLRFWKEIPMANTGIDSFQKAIQIYLKFYRTTGFVLIGMLE